MLYQHTTIAPKKAYKWLCFVIVALSYTTTTASHIMGSDITYKCIDKLKYEVTLKIYRDCNGINLTSSQQLNLICAQGGFSTKTFNIPVIKINDITGIDKSCPLIAQSRCSGGQSPYGIEEHIYKTTIDLSPWGSLCTEFVISISISARNKAITTGGANKTFYTEATIYTDLDKCNSSPQFTTPPTALICAGKDFVFNNGAIDNIDEDILTYSFTDPLALRTLPINYSHPFSSKMPLTFLGFPNTTQALPGGFHLDPNTGNINFRPMIANEVTIMVLEVVEWRIINGTKRIVGKTRRDIQINVLNCNNNTPPTIKGESDTVCTGTTLCIPISANDINSADKVTLTWNAGIPGAVFNVYKSSNPLIDSAVVCWTPKPEQARDEPYFFTITATDNSCPLQGRAVKAISVFVKQGVKPDFTINDSIQCEKNHSFDFVNATPNKNDYTFKWLFTDGKQIYATDVKGITFNNVGRHTASLIVNESNGCISAANKQFVIHPSPSNNFNPSPLKTQYCITNPPSTYSLLPIPTGGIFTGKYIVNNAYTPTLAGTDTVAYSITQNGCTSDTLVPIKLFATPQASFTMSDSEQCITHNQFDFINTSTIQNGSYTNRWWFSDGQSSTNESVYNVKFDDTKRYYINLVVTSDNGCADSTQKSVVVLAEPNPDFFGLKDYYCQQKPILQLLPIQPGGTFIGKNIINNKYVPSILGNDTIKYTIDLYGCYAEKTRYTTVYPVPVMDIITRVPCYKNPIELDVSFPNSTYLWHDGSTLPTYTINQTGQYSVALYNVCDTIEKTITVSDCFYSIVPTGFTPNGDGLNDVFLPFIQNAESMLFEIYNRWGEKIFESDDLAVGWDGTYKGIHLPEGVYVWTLKAAYYDNDLILHKKVDRGNITLLR